VAQRDAPEVERPTLRTVPGRSASAAPGRPRYINARAGSARGTASGGRSAGC
jgi:hypothetical protein